jgi:hypothetical protein
VYSGLAGAALFCGILLGVIDLCGKGQSILLASSTEVRARKTWYS